MLEKTHWISLKENDWNPSRWFIQVYPGDFNFDGRPYFCYDRSDNYMVCFSFNTNVDSWFRENEIHYQFNFRGNFQNWYTLQLGFEKVEDATLFLLTWKNII